MTLLDKVRWGGALLGLLGVALLLAGCRAASSAPVEALPQGGPSPWPSKPAPQATRTPLLPTPAAAPTALPSLTPTATPLLTPTPEPAVWGPLVVIDAGHGGKDLGARHFDETGHMDFYEAQVNLDLALRVRDLLIARGYRVLLTRNGDYRLFDDQDVNGDGEVNTVDESQARVDFINASGADAFLSIHQNAFEYPDGRPVGDVGGTVVYYCADRSFSDRSLLLAQAVHDKILEAFHDLGHDVRDRSVLDDSVLREKGVPGAHLILLGPESERIVRPSEMPGVLSETLFITHDREAKLARDPVALDRLARAYADAFDAYFEALREAAGGAP